VGGSLGHDRRSQLAVGASQEWLLKGSYRTNWVCEASPIRHYLGLSG